MNQSVLQEFYQTLPRDTKNSSRILAVTKYLSPEKTTFFLPKIQKDSLFCGVGENRIAAVLQKNIPRPFCHFIGNIQSRDIPGIAENCGVVHSLCSLKHVRLFSEQKMCPKVFLQINISNEKEKGGVRIEAFPGFLSEILKFPLEVIGISAIGKKNASLTQKRAEFEKLKMIRNRYNTEWQISAGTSEDYLLALEAGIDVIRIGRKLWE